MVDADVGAKQTAARELVATLSPLEFTVLQWIVRGGSNDDVAEACSLDARQVAEARAALMRKLSARSTADAVRIGIYAEVET